MKIFSAKNVQFTNLSISGEAPVSQGDIGTAPNQIPLNKDLGSLAYMNAPEIEDLNVDTLELREIAAEMSDTAVDVFVYDTRRDSDGGAWRERTSHTSWYNEPLNTATRGGRREFPAVAVIVAEASKVTIYDGDDPDLSMWMVFDGDYMFYNNISSIYMLNGDLYCGTNTTTGVRFVEFLKDRIGRYSGGTTALGYWPINIAEREISTTFQTVGEVGVTTLVDATVNDVAMTVLPNAPIDDDTGLPIPTIAVATDGGVSVIRDDGSVVDITLPSTYSYIYNVSFIGTDKIAFSADVDDRIRSFRVDSIPSSDVAITDQLQKQGSLEFYADGAYSNNTDIQLTPQSSLRINDILATSYNNRTISSSSTTEWGGIYGIDVATNPSESLHSHTTSTYNTGWMPGDIKLATLSDTKNETVGVDETTELVTNGTFDSDVSGWTNIDPSGSPDATITWSNGTAQVFRPTGQTGRFVQTIDTIVGAKYFIQIGNYGGSSGGVYVADSDDASSWNIIANNGQVIRDNNKHYFTATTTSAYIILNNSLENQAVTFDNISVKQTGELITNGTFDNGTMGWEQAAANWSVVNEEVVNSTQEATYFDQGINCIPGEKYVLSFDITQNFVSNQNGVYIRNSDSSSYVERRIQDGSTGSFSLEFVAIETTHYIRLYRGVEAGTIAFDNISVRLAEEDRSVNNNGLQVFGEIDKTPVAPGADLVAYSGFSADNYLMQPYNPDLDFGTGDFCIMGWFKQSPTTDFHTYFDRGGEIVAYVNQNTSVFNFRVDDGPNHINCLSTSVVDNDTWTFFVGIKSGTTLYNYINGKLETTASDASLGSLDGQFSSSFGVSFDGARYADTMALWRVSATVPTDAQIAKIYRDEKVLFQDGAQATLYGTSDAVTALAYDDKTEQLHVGTSSGRSDFAGLRRINNTTTAVTTSISASNNLIAEQ